MGLALFGLTCYVAGHVGGTLLTRRGLLGRVEELERDVREWLGPEAAKYLGNRPALLGRPRSTQTILSSS